MATRALEDAKEKSPVRRFEDLENVNLEAYSSPLDARVSTTSQRFLGFLKEWWPLLFYGAVTISGACLVNLTPLERAEIASVGFSGVVTCLIYHRIERFRTFEKLTDIPKIERYYHLHQKNNWKSGPPRYDFFQAYNEEQCRAISLAVLLQQVAKVGCSDNDKKFLTQLISEHNEAPLTYHVRPEFGKHPLYFVKDGTTVAALHESGLACEVTEFVPILCALDDNWQNSDRKKIVAQFVHSYMQQEHFMRVVNVLHSLHPDTIAVLIEHGIDVNSIDENGHPPLYNVLSQYTARGAYFRDEIVDLLLIKGAVVSSEINQIIERLRTKPQANEVILRHFSQQ